MRSPLADEEAAPHADIVTTPIAATRIAAGLIQGLVLYWLYRATLDKAWPADTPALFHPLLLTSSLLPPLFITGLGHLRATRLLAWLLSAGPLLAALAAYANWRIAPLAPPVPGLDAQWIPGAPMQALLPASIAGLFVAQSLILAGAAQGRLRHAYRARFEASWKLAIQMMFSFAFALAFWLLLCLGAQLLLLVKVDLLWRLSRESRFLIPAMSTAFACALHVTDVRSGVVRSIRSVVLTLLCWLLPVAAAIVIGFLLCLPWTGLGPLWATRHASLVLIGVALALLLLINAAYQDGGMAARVPLPLRCCARAAALCLPPLIAIAAHALFLRVAQHGWTSARIVAACGLALLGMHATAYAIAALRRQGMDEIARVNTAGAFLFLALLLALLTPLADPARLSVASQVARLESGSVAASRFDFGYLVSDGVRYGRHALARLEANARGEDAALIRQRAQDALRKPTPQDGGRDVHPGREELVANLRILPPGANLPPSFLAQDWSKSAQRGRLPACLTTRGKRCDAFSFDMNGDGRTEVLLLAEERAAGSAVLAEDGDGQWRQVLRLPWQAGGCVALRDRLAAGDYRLLPHAWPDLEVFGSRMPLNADVGESGEFRCRDAPK